MLNVRKAGFSLLELTVVIAIIGIMTVVLLVNLSGSRKQKDVENASREVAAAVREAQNNALTGKNVTTGCNYQFSYNSLLYTGNTNYGISGCSNTAYSLKNGVTFNGSGSINFSIPFASPSSTMSFPISISVCKGSDCYYKVCVNQVGNIEEKKGSEACP